MVKCKVEFECGYGILTKNPEEVDRHELRCYRNLVWIKYDGHWYLSKGKLDLENTIHYINNAYCKWQVIDRIMDLI